MPASCRRSGWRWRLACSALVAATSCSSPPTQLVVAVGSDYEVPSELSSLEVQIIDEAELVLAEETLELGPPSGLTLPLSFAVLPRAEGPDRPLTIEITGADPFGAALVVRRHTTRFIAERSLVLPIFLARACATVSCRSGETCSENGCTKQLLDPETLAEAEPGTELSSLPGHHGADAGLGDAAASTDAAPGADTMETPAVTDASVSDAQGADAEGSDAVTLDAQPLPVEVLLPSNLPADSCERLGTERLVASGTVTVDTNTATCARVVPQPGGAPQICVLTYRSFEVPAGAAFEVHGRRPLAIVAGDLVIRGIVDASGRAAKEAPLTPFPGTGSTTESRAGGGGAGHGTAGAPGAASVTSNGAVGGAAGAPYGSANLVPLWPGSPGGLANGWLGGQGGGAIQLVGCQRLSLGATAVIDAGGQGAEGGLVGGGGGSGGAILLEGNILELTPGARIAANGGGGGAGGSIETQTLGTPGGDGRRASTAATGGSSQGSGGGNGGNGGALNALPTPGSPNADAFTACGGGGGAVGRIRINTPRLQGNLPNGVIVSPSASLGTVVLR